MKKLSYFICLIFISFAVVSCEENAPNNLNIDNLDTIEPEKRLLTPAEQKEKLSNVANDFVAQFNSTHFASLVKLIDECSYKFRDYNWEAYEENLLSVENFIGKLSNIITETQTGNIPVNTDAYIFSIDRISAKYEADERTQSWKVTPTDNGKLTILFTNMSGEECEIIVSTSPKSYNITSYYNYNDADSHDMTAQPFEAVVPERINIIIKEGKNEHLNATCNLKLEKNKLFNLRWSAKIATLTFKVNIYIDSQSAQTTFSIDQNQQNLITTTVSAPSCRLLGKEDSDSVEKWIEKLIEEYGEAFANHKTITGELSVICNIMNRIQIIGTCDDISNILAGFEDLSDEYDYDSRQYNIKVADLLNNSMKFNLYYSSDILQASLKWDVTSEEIEDYSDTKISTKTYYAYSPVIHFPAENTSYSFGEYFTSDIYSSPLKQIKDLCNSYINMLKYIEIEPIEF